MVQGHGQRQSQSQKEKSKSRYLMKKSENFIQMTVAECDKMLGGSVKHLQPNQFWLQKEMHYKVGYNPLFNVDCSRIEAIIAFPRCGELQPQLVTHYPCNLFDIRSDNWQS